MHVATLTCRWRKVEKLRGEKLSFFAALVLFRFWQFCLPKRVVLLVLTISKDPFRPFDKMFAEFTVSSLFVSNNDQWRRVLRGFLFLYTISAHAPLLRLLLRRCVKRGIKQHCSWTVNNHWHHLTLMLFRYSVFLTPITMHMKSPSGSENHFVGGGDSYEESSSDYEELQDSEGDDFSEFLWMENEEEFDDQELQKLEEQELMNECMQAMNELELLDEIKQVEAETFDEWVSSLSSWRFFYSIAQVISVQFTILATRSQTWSRSQTWIQTRSNSFHTPSWHQIE